MPGLPAQLGDRRRRTLLPGSAGLAGTCLDPPPAAPHHPPMDRAQLIAELQNLSARLDELGAQARRLSDENRSLRMQQEQLANERSTLLAKNEQARTRVEAMIARLKSLEQHT